MKDDEPKSDEAAYLRWKKWIENKFSSRTFELLEAAILQHRRKGRQERAPEPPRDTIGSINAAKYVQLIRTGSNEQGLFYLIGLLKHFNIIVTPDDMNKKEL